MIQVENRRWVIVTLAIVMFFISIFLIRINGTLFSIYLYIWITVGYFGYKNNTASIKVFLEVLLFISLLILFILIFLELSKNSLSVKDKIPLSISVLIMIVPKIFLYNFCNMDMNIHYSESIQNSQIYLGKNNAANDLESNMLLNTSEPKINDEELWEIALNEFDSDHQKKGLYAKLFSLHRGNEIQIKSDYIFDRFNQLKTEQIEKHVLNLKNQHEQLINQRIEDSIKEGTYKSKFFKGVESLFFANGQAAIKINQKKYRLYKNTASLEKSLKYFVESGMFLSTDLIREIEFDDQKVIIDCPRCYQKIKVIENQEIEIACQSCNFRWTEQS